MEEGECQEAMKAMLRFLTGLLLTAACVTAVLFGASYYAFVILNDDFPYAVAIGAIMMSLVTLGSGVCFSVRWAWRKPGMREG